MDEEAELIPCSVTIAGQIQAQTIDHRMTTAPSSSTQSLTTTPRWETGRGDDPRDC